MKFTQKQVEKFWGHLIHPGP